MPMFDDFARELARGLCRPMGEDATMMDIVTPLVVEPLMAAHRAAAAKRGGNIAPDVWIRAIAGAALTGSTTKDVAVAAANRVFDSVLAHVQTGPSFAAASPNAAAPPFPNGAKFPTTNGFPSPQKPNFSSVRGVVNAIQKFGKVGVLEMFTLPQRLLIAQAVEAGAVAIPGVRSTRGLGGETHQRIQRSYLSSNETHVTVVDRRVFGPGYRVFVAALTDGIPLSEAARSLGPHQTCFGAMYLSWVTRNWDSLLRTDLTDVTIRANWEIKPLLGAVQGVLQEAWYRCSLNWLAGVLAEQQPELAADLAPFKPGGAPGCALLRFTQPGPGSDGTLVVPFTIPMLPGLILYAVVSGPAVADLAVMAVYLLAQIQAKIKSSGKAVLGGLAAAREAVAELAGWMLVVLIALICFCAVVIVAVLAFDAIAAAAAAVAGAGAAFAAFVAESLAALGIAAAAAGLIMLIVDPSTLKRPTDPNDASQRAVALNFGPVAITMPARAAGMFISTYELAIEDAYGSLCDALAMGPPNA